MDYRQIVTQSICTAQGEQNDCVGFKPGAITRRCEYFTFYSKGCTREMSPATADSLPCDRSNSGDKEKDEAHRAEKRGALNGIPQH